MDKLIDPTPARSTYSVTTTLGSRAGYLPRDDEYGTEAADLTLLPQAILPSGDRTEYVLHE
jgi:hypothetical protein